jgi:hypothetical protein
MWSAIIQAMQCWPGAENWTAVHTRTGFQVCVAPQRLQKFFGPFSSLQEQYICYTGSSGSKQEFIFNNMYFEQQIKINILLRRY